MSEGFIRETTLTNLILNFLKDSNQWVKIAAYKMIGPFIYTLEGLKINELLIEQYSKMLESLEFGPCTDNEVEKFLNILLNFFFRLLMHVLLIFQQF